MTVKLFMAYLPGTDQEIEISTIRIPQRNSLVGGSRQGKLVCFCDHTYIFFGPITSWKFCASLTGSVLVILQQFVQSLSSFSSMFSPCHPSAVCFHTFLISLFTRKVMSTVMNMSWSCPTLWESEVYIRYRTQFVFRREHSPCALQR